MTAGVPLKDLGRSVVPGEVVFYRDFGFPHRRKFGTVCRVDSVTFEERIWCKDWGYEKPREKPNRYETYMPNKVLFLVVEDLKDEEIWE